jgi:predicted DNA-binding transcriptional regulator AlpA
MSDDLERFVSASQAAAVAGVKPDTFTSYVNRGFAPAPAATIAGRRVWDRDEIAAWAKARRARRDKSSAAS